MHITNYNEMVGWLLSKKRKTTSVSKDMEQLEPLCTVGEM